MLLRESTVTLQGVAGVRHANMQSFHGKVRHSQPIVPSCQLEVLLSLHHNCSEYCTVLSSLHNRSVQFIVIYFTMQFSCSR
jgi:hypothetical protein